ncbi:MAG: hypothetical protein JWN07_3352 [Hyphomicrobiales bacterium]|nr:hypothetical protein [Hyphomicrobiales bacterium]
MILRAAALVLLLASPALAQEASECGACTELDRVTTADPVLPMELPAPPLKQEADKGKKIEVPVPGTHDTITVFHKPGAGVWVSDLAPGGIFVRPKNNKLSVEMKF